MEKFGSGALILEVWQLFVWVGVELNGRGVRRLKEKKERV
jgi:hypothetical protein